MTEPPAFERRERPRAGPSRRVLDLFYSALRFVGRHIGGFYGAVLTYLSFSFFVFLAAAALFGAFAERMAEGDTQALDEWVLRSLEGHRRGWIDYVALEITALGNGATLILVVLLAGIFLWISRHRFSVLLLAIAVIGGQAMNALLKDAFNRPRPTVVEHATEVASYSFPSGHAMAATVAYGTVAYLVGRLEPTRVQRLTTWTVAVVIILLIGLTRIYLGVHYPSDVLAGFVAGAAWTAFVASGLAAVRYFAYRDPRVESSEHHLHAEEERSRQGQGGELASRG